MSGRGNAPPYNFHVTLSEFYESDLEFMIIILDRILLAIKVNLEDWDLVWCPDWKFIEFLHARADPNRL